MDMRSWAIFLGMPTSKVEFCLAVERGYCIDYMNLTCRDEPLERVWEQRYKKICASADRLIHLASALDMQIFRGATLAHLEAAAQSCDTLLVFAHWKGESVNRNDLPRDLRLFFNSVNGRNDEVRHFIYERLKPVIRTKADSSSVAAEIAEILDALVKNQELLRFVPQNVVNGFSVESPMRAAICRDVLDREFMSIVSPGNRLELFDGLHPPGSVLSAIPKDFDGVIDLITCESVILGTFLESSLGLRTKVIKNRFPVDPGFEYALVGRVLRCCVDNELGYLDARFAIDRERSVPEVLRQLYSEYLSDDYNA